MSQGFLFESTLLLAIALALGRFSADAGQRAAHTFIAVCSLPLLWLADRLHIGWQPMVHMVTAGNASTPAPDSVWAGHALATLYALVAAARLLRWLGAQIAGHRLERRARPCLQPGWQHLNAQVAARVGKRQLPVRVLDDIGAPFLAGLLRPAIYIPSHLLSCSDARARHVLLHEYAHLRAGDGWRVPLVELACCLLWFHPLLHLLQRQFLRDIELACDARVVRSGEDAHDYATTLAHCAARHRKMRVAGLGMSVRQSDLVQRVRLIMSDGGSLALQRRPWIAALLGVVALSLSAFNPSPRIVYAHAESATVHRPIAIPVGLPTAELVVANGVSSEVAPAPVSALPRRARAAIDSAPPPMAESTVSPPSGHALVPGSAPLWQAIQGVAVEDAKAYAVSQTALEPKAVAPDPRFENGLRQASAERSKRRQRVMKRVWPLLGHVPL